MRISDWSSDVCSSDLTAVIYDTAANVLERVLVNVTTKKILELEEIDQTVHGTAPFLEEELFSPIELIMADEDCQKAFFARGIRSEEHTSELQSLMRISYAVFCLKNKHSYDITNAPHVLIALQT